MSYQDATSVQEVPFQLWKGLNQAHISLFMCVAWQIWKAGCSFIFQDKQCKPLETLKKALIEHTALCLPLFNPQFGTSSAAGNGHMNYSNPKKTFQCWMDGSFDENGKRGAAYILKKEDTLISYELTYSSEAISPFHMEACAMLLASRWQSCSNSITVVSIRIRKCWYRWYN